MRLPFTQQQFFEVFAQYNQAVWPAQIGAYVVGVGALLLAFRRNGEYAWFMWLALAAFWIFTGFAYHIAFFAPINPVASLFGWMFVFQGLLYLYMAVRQFRFSLPANDRARLFSAWTMFVYSLIVYPLLNTLLGHIYPGAPVFGITPCPATIFTFGVLIAARERIPPILLIVPILWSVIATSAAFQLSVYPDIALPISAVVAWTLIRRRNRISTDKLRITNIAGDVGTAA